MAVEFALIAPVFLSMLLGIIVYGLYFTTLIAVTQLASETARAAIAGVTTAEQTTLATNQFALMITGYAPLMTTTNTKLTFPTASAGTFSVHVAYDFTSLGLAGITLVPVPTSLPVTVQVSTGSP